MLSTTHRFLFVHIPKTGGNSIQERLLPFADDELVCRRWQDGVDTYSLVHPRLRSHKHSCLYEYRAMLDDQTWNGLFKFACVRNPWEWAISHFFSPYLGRDTWDRGAFIAFLDTLQPQSHFLSLDPRFGLVGRLRLPFTRVRYRSLLVRDFPEQDWTGNVDMLLRFEHLQEDLDRACERIGIRVDPLPVRNKSERRPYTEYYDDELVELVADRFPEDVARLGYRFGD